MWNNIILDNPKYLYLAIPLVLCILLPFILILVKKRANFQNCFSLFLHIVIIGILSISATGIKTQETTTETSIYLLADVSSTTERKLNEMDEYITSFKEKASVSSEIGVVAFAKDVEVLVPLGNSLKSLSTATVDTSATNIENALMYTASLFEASSKKRIVLLSDGKETDGNARNYYQSLLDSSIRLDAVYFDSSLTQEDFEMQLVNVTGSTSTFLNEEEKMTITLRSTYESDSILKILQDEKIFKEETIHVNNGLTTLSYVLPTNEVGKHTYSVSIEDEKDYNEQNNSFLFNQEIVEKANVLILSSGNSSSRYLEQLINSTANITTIYPYSYFDNSLDNLILYDEIFLDNVDISEFKDYMTLTNNLQSYVANYGKSLITVGGEKTYENGYFSTTALKNMLPVDTNPSETKNSTALVICLDTSDSMSGASLQMAKQGIIQVMDILDENDYLGIVTFGSTTSIFYPLSQMKATAKRRITSALDGLHTTGGTLMTSGLEMAYSQIKNAKNINREVMLISDGMPGDGGQVNVIEAMAEENITTSSINIGSQGGGTLMNSLATAGNGRYYYMNSADSLPNIMHNEVAEITMEVTIEADLALKVALPNDPVVENVSDLPNITGINYSSAKFNSNTVISTTATLKNEMVVENVPIYTYWNYGEGKVASYMSDAKPTWNTTLISNQNAIQLFKNIVKTNLPTTHSTSAFIIDIQNNGYTSNITVNVPKIISRAELKATLTSPSGIKSTQSLTLSNGLYKGLFETGEIGNYSLTLDYSSIATMYHYSYTEEFAFVYSKEYDAFTNSDTALLWELVDQNGTLSDNVEEIVNINQEDVVTDTYYTIPLLICALLLFILDVIVRKLKWKDITRLFKKKEKTVLS